MTFRDQLFQTRSAFIVTLLVSLGALGSALIGQIYFGLKPCEMCIYQRIPYALLILGSVIALVIHAKQGALGKLAKPVILFYLVLFTLLFLIESGLAFFHFGIEQHWWTLEKGCAVTPLTAQSTEDALKELLATPQVECDKPGWIIAGLSITVWNTALSLLMAAYLTAVMIKTVPNRA